MPHATTREDIFAKLGIAQLCSIQNELCHLWRNNLPIDQQSTERIHLSEEDYVKIYVGELEDPDTCLSDIDLVQNDTEDAQLSPLESDHSGFFQRAVDTLSQACDRCARALQPITARVAPEHLTSVGPLGGHDRPPQQEPLHRITQNFFQGVFQRLQQLFLHGALLECTGEGPIAYIDTWYVHHQRQRICREGRPLRIAADATTWKDEILALWEDVLDPDSSTVIHLVRPSPPCARTECVLAHLILEQSERLHHVVGLITIHAQDQHGDSTQHTAYSLPNAMTAQSVLRMAEMNVFCQTRLCSVRLGAWPFGIVDIDDVPRAAGLSINIRPLISINEESDSMELMQRSRSRTRWRRDLTPQDGQDSSSTPHRCAQTNFHFNPAAPAFDPTAPNIFTMNENIQELHQYWLRTAFSWEGETPSTTIQTWFVDHHNPNLWACTQSRAVRLFEDFTQWETQIRHT